jgi:outer membrane protein assembly factor BamB/tetratricopeptide (TPR) repeat protein
MFRTILRSLAIASTLSAAAFAQAPVVSDAPTSVSIPDSPAAVERLDKAKEKEDQKQWKTAAEYYQEALNKYSRRVVPYKIDKEADIFQYVGVGERVQERLAKWPQEGLDAYRTAYGQTAADLLAAAGRDDLPALDNVFRTYFITDAGKSAGIRLMDVHLEAGQFFAAAWIGQRLLTLHPMLGPDRPLLLFRTALAYHWAGDSTNAAALLDELRKVYPNEIGSIGGKDIVLVEALDSALKSPVPTPATQPSDADRWPTFGGIDGRGDISSSSAKSGASLYSIALIPPNTDHIPPPQKFPYEQTDQQDLAAGQAMGIMPATDRGALFFQDGRHIYAVNADSGQPLTGWSNSGDENYGIDVFGRARGEQLTITVTSDRVLAVLGQMDRQAPLVGQAMTPSVRIVCLDRSNGKPLWIRSPSNLPESAAPLRLAEYNGTPLVVGDDSVLVIARGGKGNEFEDCYVVCLSLKTGDYKWSTYVGSASRIFDGEIGQGAQDASEMSLAEGRVFVLSNLGTIAALDPIDGRMIWLNSYPRDVIDNPEAAAMMLRNRMMGNGSAPQSKPWANNPVIVTAGKVFVLPSEGKHLLVYDAGTGEELKRIITADYENADVLLGVRGNAAILTSDKYCYCLDWSAYDHDNPKSAILWDKLAVADSIAGEDNLIWGRGFLTSDSVFIPTKHRLVQISWLKSGRLLSTYPARGVWPGAEEPGNVLVTSQNVIVAGSKQVSVYTDMDRLRREYHDRVAAAPDDPGPRIWFAELLFSSDADEALGKIDEAINLTGGLGNMRTGPDRQQIFSTALHCAQEAAAENPLERATLPDRCFDRAAAAADSAREKATYRLARAGYDQEQKNYSGSVSLCQEILSDPAMRAVAVTENTTAAAQAEADINDAIQADRSSYSAVEQSAAVALSAAKKSTDPQKLLAVGSQYPNSSAAVEARQAAAGLQEAQGDHRAAIQTLQQMYSTAADSAAKARLLEGVARNFLALPDSLGSAIDRLTRAVYIAPASRLSQPLVFPDGTTLVNLSFADAVSALRKIQFAADSARLPDFQLSVPKSARDKVFSTTDALVIANVRVLVPALRDFARNDRVVTWSDNALSVFEPGATTALSTANKIPEEPLACAWLNQKLLVWTPAHVLLFNDDGIESWRTDLHGLPTLPIASDADAVSDDSPMPSDVQSAVVLNGGGRIIINGRRRFMIRNGAIFPLMPGAAVPLAHAPPAVPGEKVVAVRPAGNRVVMTTSIGRLVALDASEGHIVWQTQLSNSPITQLLANPHFTVARLDDSSGMQLVVFETSTGQVIGRRKFGAQDTPSQLVNAALSEDGSLAFTLSNRLLVKDLYEPWKIPPTDLTGKPDVDPPAFSGLNLPDQLLIQAGRVVALYDGGKFVRVQDLASNQGAGNPLATRAETNNVWLRLVGPQLFIVHSKTMARYNLEDASDSGIALEEDLDFTPHVHEMLLGRDYAILVDYPIEPGPDGSSLVRLLAYRRSPFEAHSTHESGRLDDDPIINNAAHILSWQGVDGGLYYLTGDQKLHFLKGATR